MLTTAQSSESNHKVLISKARAVEKTKLEAVTKAEASLKEKQQKLEQSDAFKAVVIAKQLLKEGQSALKSAKARTAKAETELRNAFQKTDMLTEKSRMVRGAPPKSARRSPRGPPVYNWALVWHSFCL